MSRGNLREEAYLCAVGIYLSIIEFISINIWGEINIAEPIDLAYMEGFIIVDYPTSR